MRSATHSALLSLSRSSIRRINSSPPSLPKVSPGLMSRPTLFAVSTSTQSPALVAQTVIDQLEAVKVKKEDDRKAVVVLPSPSSHRMVKPVHEKRPVRKAREGIVKSVMEQLLSAIRFPSDMSVWDPAILYAVP